MKVLFYHLVPFALAHGSFQVEVFHHLESLSELGIEVECLRWWDGEQKGDILHFFGRVSTGHLQQAHRKGMKVVQTDLLTEQASRPQMQLNLQKMLRRVMVGAVARRLAALFNWNSYELVDASVASTEREALLMRELYGAPPGKVHVVPSGVRDVFLNSRPMERGSWLICAAPITEDKRVLELAQAAVRAQTPLWVIGNPSSGSYAQRFFTLAKASPAILRYEASISAPARLAQVYREARGFVLLSDRESMDLSVLEAAACECPLLLSRLPWATNVFREHACYCPVTSSASRTAAYLRQFYDAAPGLKPPPRPLSWLEVGRQLKVLYETLLDQPQTQ